MEKSKIKSILPKPTPSPSGCISPLSGMHGDNSHIRKRSSIDGEEFNVSKKQRSRSKSSRILDKSTKQTGHRPVTSCTFCRQHKIKCNASDNYPNPCQRCDRMGLKCEIDPEFRPKKGSQIQSLKSDVDDLKAKIELLTKNETLLTQALNQHNMNLMQQQSVNVNQSPFQESNFQFDQSPNYHSSPSVKLNDSLENNNSNNNNKLAPVNIFHENSDNSPASTAKDSNTELLNYEHVSEFVLGDVRLPLEKANELHDRFMQKNLPFIPIFTSNSANELYHKSQLLFWTVMLTASLSESEPTLYMSLASLIMQLAIETCWIRTPRSTHVIQALIILSIWPLPNEKVLDDCSYRFVGLAKNLALQLGLHRSGEFIQEFLRTQVSLGPDAERWRTRSWLAVFFCEHFWSSVLGLPPSINTTDYLLENARIDTTLPKNFRCLISLSIFQCKLVNVMGISVTRPDGLLDPLNRASSLNLLDRELERLRFKLSIDDSSVEVYYLYIKLMICCFAFLPGTPIEDQVKYVSASYSAATRIITITSQMINTGILLIELPIYVRQAITYSVFLLFKLHLSRYLVEKYVDSARQLIVTVHRLLRNTLLSWKDLQNDISRTAKVLENLNIVLYTYPDIFQNDEAGGSIITRMRSHLTASLFYDLVWCVHEARRRTLLDKNKSRPIQVEPSDDPEERRPRPLPFYNQITKDHFNTITSITPNGTTITTLVPTDYAMNEAKVNAAGMNKPLEINGIPLSMLEATGSVRDTLKNEPAQSPEYHHVQMLDPIQQPMIISHETAIEHRSPIEVEQLNGIANQMDSFFQQQSNGWLNNDNYQDDDFLGWFDVNMLP
ncbi:uncharacterized protein PRCAT00004198001 [Priceomyces carsonii]|uniref:uncharacterized protein n=1 Tax=Priceomyces carsonii TaxID=28549 RepID=UPI002EDB68A9|nr:unnamed protein product [Priceomyces carsonii]